jgi:hypothetical protein
MSGNLRLNGTTSGYSELTAPAVAGDQTFTFPAVGGELIAGNNAPGGGQVVGHQHGSFAASVNASDYFWCQNGTVLNGDYNYFTFWRTGQIVTINALFRFGGGAVPPGVAGSLVIVSNLPYNTKPNDTGTPFVAWPGVQTWFGLANFDASSVQFLSYAFTGGAGQNYIRCAYRTGGSASLQYITASNIGSTTQTNLQFTYETDDTTWIPNS